MWRLKSTAGHKRFWKNRKIDWQKQYLATWEHPHRQLIVWVLQSFNWVSLWEIGCGPGANLARIVTNFQGKQLGGSDVNADAIDLAKKTFKGGRFHVESFEDMLLSDNATDVMLSDATLIYCGPTKIRKTLKEMIRIARNQIVLCEFNSTNFWKRQWLRITTGYNAYDYKKLLEEEGCYDVQIAPIPPGFWDGFPWQPWGRIIVAKIPKK